MTNNHTEFDFTLILHGIDDFDDSTARKLFEAGCDDATLARRLGRVFVTFARSAPSLVDAIISAIVAIEKADIGAKVLRIDECNLVTQAEIARRLGRKRQNISQYISGQRGSGGFPAPVCNITDNAPLYAWCEVAYWAHENALLANQRHEEAQAISTLNTILELEYQKVIAPEITKKMLDQFRVCGPAPAKTDADNVCEMC